MANFFMIFSFFSVLVVRVVGLPRRARSVFRPGLLISDPGPRFQQTSPFCFFAGNSHAISQIVENSRMQAVVFIEAKGKANAWTRIARRLGMTATVVPTIGHVCSFPRKLYPIGIDLSSGEGLEKERHPIPEKRRAILEAVSNAPAGAAIIIATDDDVEGDVIAYDVADIVYSAFPERARAIVRVRPGPITVRGIRTSLASAQPLERILVQMTSDAIPGRARAVTDRWIGATFSRIAGAPVGRVRSAILGATYLLNRAPEKLRGRPETGEITLQARSAMGGRPFVARVPLAGAEDPARVARLRDLAQRYAMRVVPGSVRPLMSLSAAVAPRIGTVRPFNTADALAHAARHHGIPVRMAMQGLQDAYLRGMISYPRTSGRGISAESAAHVEMLAHSCGITGLDVEVLSSDNMLAGPAPGTHEGLHPVLPLSTENSDVLRTLIRKPLRAPEGGWDRTSVMQAMVALVSRRAFEAAREIAMERGNWGPDNGDMGIRHQEEGRGANRDDAPGGGACGSARRARATGKSHAASFHGVSRPGPSRRESPCRAPAGAVR
ncbi:hypothetical protein GE300_14595 [Rhodobacteraceae bacterium 2CG4]|uniref:Topo IA-type catalytic domain-containing protein n=1 Tax=Halovulum marinum TaxID=2662447 RepID=A0A6L5Z410_9RHOB|nr:hypothetical protein [Halovulum marinum]